ncbi:MAG TPA: cytochrome P450, partial [Solirubrobacteraceae bacterium]
EPMSDRELRDQLLTMLVAGHETTATALAWAFERILRHPEVLRRLRAELAEGRTAYLDAAIKETLRLRPVVPITARKLTVPFELGGRTYPAGTVLMPCIFLLHRNPEIYERPDEFRPERFLDWQPPPYAWIPFGGGGRRCLGAGFALAEMRAVMQTVLTRVELRAASQRDERVVRRAFTLSPRDGTRVVVTRRL